MIYNCNDLEIISKLRNENRYLKDEIKEETGKLRNTIKVLDKETNRYLYSFKIISNNNRVLVGYFSDHKMINIFTFNKITKYAKYSNTYFDEQGGGQIGVGKCYTKTI